MKKVLAVLASVLVLSMLITGCSPAQETSDPADEQSNSTSVSTGAGEDSRTTFSTTPVATTTSTQKPEKQVKGTFIFGGKDSNDKTYLIDQGEKNFYYLCSPEVNKKGKYDFSKFHELALTQAEEWKPSQADQEKYGNGYWFTIKDDGSLFPCDDFCGVVQFKAPADGKYNIKIEYYGLVKWDAPDKPTDIIPDGVYLSAFVKNDKVLEHDATEKEMDALTYTKNEVTMKKGDTITVVADPKKNSGWDLSNWTIIVEQMG